MERAFTRYEKSRTGRRFVGAIVLSVLLYIRNACIGCSKSVGGVVTQMAKLSVTLFAFRTCRIVDTLEFPDELINALFYDWVVEGIAQNIHKTMIFVSRYTLFSILVLPAKYLRKRSYLLFGYIFANSPGGDRQ